MIDKFDIFYIVLIVSYLIGVTWYLRSVLMERQEKKESNRSFHRSIEADGEKKNSFRRRKGKHCPKCRNLIDHRRSVCQHCGHQFELDPQTPPHPEEAAKGLRETPSSS